MNSRLRATIHPISRPAAAVAKPHSACPLAASGATWVAKYGANTKVVINVK